MGSALRLPGAARTAVAAFLQRVVNGGRQRSLGRGRTDLLIVGRRGRQHASSCTKEPGRTVRDGIEQTAAYMDRCGAEEGHLILFDRTEGKPWADKLFRREEPIDGGAVTVWGM